MLYPVELLARASFILPLSRVELHVQVRHKSTQGDTEVSRCLGDGWSAGGKVGGDAVAPRLWCDAGLAHDQVRAAVAQSDLLET